jgi:hypothetical protein
VVEVVFGFLGGIENAVHGVENGFQCGPIELLQGLMASVAISAICDVDATLDVLGADAVFLADNITDNLQVNVDQLPDFLP